MVLELELSAGIATLSALALYLGWKEIGWRKKVKELTTSNKELRGTISTDVSTIQTYQNELALSEKTLASYGDITDRELHIRNLEEQIKKKKAEREEADKAFQKSVEDNKLSIKLLKQEIKTLEKELKPLEEVSFLESFGFYERQYDFASASRYQSELEKVYENQKDMVKSEEAAVCDQTWVVGGSEKEGQKLVKSFIKTMLRAFNGECDACVSRAKYNNIQTMSNRITASYEFLNKNGKTFSCRITQDYLSLKIEELRLTYEYQVQKQEEIEEQRRIREQMREEERAQKELEKVRIETEREEKRYQKALEDAKKELEGVSDANRQSLLAEIEKLNQRLAEVKTSKERAQSMAELTRSGYVYIISNVGSFGENVFKIGMTRRVDPMERVNELGDASVPFPFDVHAIISTNDAPSLENLLHKKFHNQRLNVVNDRKEFFSVSIEDIEAELDRNSLINPEIKFKLQLTKVAEASQYRQSLAKKSNA
ncbi:DUF4041 domain-containing protein [Candidatus Cyanaurora vandensis]|uniref:DUF4041 domain-containing protein n=1 Tax=Candidatus Cyanaurora vandensis TaxID=2714958 RepID=UPI00257D2A74|nr:DUF4041 domain-containing protein [Candidatus Cyanaurora vandensis]